MLNNEKSVERLRIKLEKTINTGEKANELITHLFKTMPIQLLYDSIQSMSNKWKNKMTIERKDLLDYANKIYAERVKK